MKLVRRVAEGMLSAPPEATLLNSEGLEPKLIALRNGSNDEHELLPISEPKRLRQRIMNDNLEISSFLEVLPDASRYVIGQIFAIVIFSTLPHLEDSVPYSVPIVNITLDFEVA